MDVQGIDQVMIIPTEIDTYPWLQDARRRQGVLPGLQRMGLRVHQGRSGPAVLRRAAADAEPGLSRSQEVHRVAALGCRVALVRPMDAMGNYPLQPKYEPVWNALEETGMVYGMHPFPAGGALEAAGLHASSIPAPSWSAGPSPHPACRTRS